MSFFTIHPFVKAFVIFDVLENFLLFYNSKYLHFMKAKANIFSAINRQVLSIHKLDPNICLCVFSFLYCNYLIVRLIQYRVEEKYASASVNYQNKIFFGNSLHKFKLTNPEGTLYTKVAFDKKEPFSLTHGLWRIPLNIIKKFQNLKSVSVFFRSNRLGS